MSVLSFGDGFPAAIAAGLIPPDLPLFPKSILHWIQLAMGIVCLWISFRKQPLTGRDGAPYKNQRLMRISFGAIGVVLLGVAILGLLLAQW